MKESNLVSLSVALILLFGDCFCLDRDAASSSNQRYTDYSSDINQERKKAIQDTLSRERYACSYLNQILPPENSISRNGSIRVRNNMFVAYYKYLGGTYNRGSGHTFQSTIYTKVAKYLGFAGKTVFNKLLNLRNEFNEIEPVNIKGLVAEIVANYESHPDNDSLIIAITALKDLGFSCVRIIELLELKSDFDSIFDSMQRNHNIVPVDDSNREQPFASEQSLVNNNSTERRRFINDEDDEALHLRKRRKM